MADFAAITEQPEAQVEVRYLASSLALGAAARHYNVRVSFSAGEDEHDIREVQLMVLDEHGDKLVELEDAGPFAYLGLDPGGYLVTAEYRGTVHSGKLQVAGDARALAFFHFPGE